MKKKRVSALQVTRLLIQILFFIFLPSVYIGALNGVRQIYTAFIHWNFSAALLPQIVEVIAVIPATIVLGRFFCGWMCGFGSFTDFIYKIFHRVYRKQRKIPEKADAWMKYIKYGILLFLVVVVWTFQSTWFSTASPWDVFGMLATIGKAPDFNYVLKNLTVGFILFLVVIAVSAIYERFFCHYLCPMGAVFSLVSKARTAKIKKPSVQCGNCRVCTNSCAMGIPLYRMESVNSGECINCLKCVTACPRGNAKLTIAGDDVKPLAAGAAVAAVMTGMYFAGSFAANLTGTQSAVSISQTGSSQSANKLYQDGTYQGTGTGFRGAETTVSVTVSGDKITAVSVDSYGDDRQFFEQAYSQISQAVLNSQSTDVDAVSGATFSSQGIMQAIANALNKAKLQNSVAESVNSSSSSTVSEPQTSSQEGTSSSQSELSSSQPESSSSPKSGTSYQDGTYQGTGTGFRGETSVSVTVSGGKITAVNVDSYQDDERFFSRAYSQVTQEIISSQTADVDAVSGATFSSQGIMQAVANALKSAVK